MIRRAVISGQWSEKGQEQAMEGLFSRQIPLNSDTEVT